VHADARADRQRSRAVAQERRNRRRSDLTVLTRRIDEREQERARLLERLSEVEGRDAQATESMERLREDIHRLDAGEATLTEALDVAEAKLATTDRRLTECRDELRATGSQRAAQQARAEALRAAAADATRSAEALVGAGIAGVHGGVIDLLDVAGVLGETDLQELAAAEQSRAHRADRDAEHLGGGFPVNLSAGTLGCCQFGGPGAAPAGRSGWRLVLRRVTGHPGHSPVR
jgi:predicted nuclease with TOPRIM domain